MDLLTDAGASGCTSAWEVEFRNGLLRWTEQDDFDRDALRITFAQIEGDLEAFSGQWNVIPVDHGCVVTFFAEFDLGIPSLAAFLEPVAQSAIEENVSKVLWGLFRAECQVDEGRRVTAPVDGA